MIITIVFDMVIFNVNINNRCIVIGVGLDYVEDNPDGNLSMTLQAVLATNGGTNTGNNYTIYTTVAKDVEEAMDKLGAITGTEISLAHVGAVIVGREAVKQGKYEYVEHLLADEKVSDTATIAISDDTAKNIFEAKVPIGSVASLQLTSVLLPIKKPLGNTGTSLRELLQSRYVLDGSAYLPIVKRIETPPSTDQGKDGDKTADLIVLSGTALLSPTTIIGELDQNGSDGLTLTMGGIHDGVIGIDGRNDEEVGIQIITSDSITKIEWDSKRVEIEISVKTLRGVPFIQKGLVDKQMNDVEEEQFKSEIISRVMIAFQTGLDIGHDTLMLREMFYKKYPQHLNEIISDNWLSQLNLSISVDVTQR